MTDDIRARVLAVMAWQGDPAVHPLTCIVSRHLPLVPGVEFGPGEDERVVLRCLECAYRQRLTDRLYYGQLEPHYSTKPRESP